MTASILLYGATGFSGRLIIEEFMYQVKRARESDSVGVPVRLVIAARERAKLEEIADMYGLEYRAFALDDQDIIERGLSDIDVVINAAGPFALTAQALATSALKARVHYVDINGEVDVYQRLDDFATKATNRNCALVCGAGCSATASDLLVDRALATLRGTMQLDEPAELGAIRIAMKRPVDFSRGSAQTAWRSIREQVTVVRDVEVKRGKSVRREMRATHEAVGRLERTFDFAERPQKKEDGELPRGLRIATAVEAIDTLTAQRTAKRRGFLAHCIETYMDMDAGGRLAYQVGALTAPIAAMTWVRELANFQISFLPPGPTETEREAQTHVVLLEIEDVFREKVVEARFETPNAYQFTAQVVIAIARRLASDRESDPPLIGWLTPSQVLEDTEVPEELLGRAPPAAAPDRDAEQLTDVLRAVPLEPVIDMRSVAPTALERLAPRTRAEAQSLREEVPALLRGCHLNTRIGST
jgi:short subunit dehydrogenase-like uncharacterized protein